MLQPNEDLRKQLGAALRAARRRAGLTSEALAGRLEMSQSRLSKLETGALRPSLQDIERIADILNLSKQDRAALLQACGNLHSDLRTWEVLSQNGLANLQATIRKREESTRTFSIYQNQVIPGLLQTEHYAKAVLSLGAPRSHRDLAEAVLERLMRQDILEDRSRRFRFIIAEQVLVRPIGSRGVIARQIDKLIQVARKPNVQIWVLPLSARLPALEWNSFVLLDDREVHLETLTAEIGLFDSETIACYGAYFRMLRKYAVLLEEFIRHFGQ